MSNCSPKTPIITRDAISEDALYAFQRISKNLSTNMQISWIIIIITRLLEVLELSSERHAPIEDISFRIIQYIEEHYTEPISLKSIADDLKVSEKYVSRIFSSRIKMNFRKYLGVIRAEYASSLLRTTKDKIITIAENAGFESLSTFNRVFHDIYGVSPRDFRSNINRYTGGNDL